MNIRELSVELSRGDVVMSDDVISATISSIKSAKCLKIISDDGIVDSGAVSALTDLLKSNGVRIGHFETYANFSSEKSIEFIRSLSKLHDEVCEMMFDDVVGRFVPEGSVANSDVEAASNLFYYSSGRNVPSYTPSFMMRQRTYLNGFDNAEGFMSITVNVNGDVASETTSLGAEISRFSFGNVLSSSLDEIVRSRSVDSRLLRTMEIPTEGDVSFSQYWNSISEEKRGEWFGYAFHKMFNRNIPGYGVFKMMEDFPKLSELKELEDFRIVASLSTDLPPPWAGKYDMKFEYYVFRELEGYLSMACANLFEASSVLEIANIYYSDMPYDARRRLAPVIGKILYRMKINSTGGSSEK